MKTLLIAVALLIAVISGSTALFIYSAFLYHDLQSGLERLQQQAEREEWLQAENEAAQLKKLWQQADKAWMPIMDHRQVDRVDESFIRVFRLVELKQKNTLLVEITVTRRQLLRLKETEVPKLRNIF